LTLLTRLRLSAAALLPALTTLLTALVLTALVLLARLLFIRIHNCSCVSSPGDNKPARVEFPPALVGKRTVHSWWLRAGRSLRRVTSHASAGEMRA